VEEAKHQRDDLLDFRQQRRGQRDRGESQAGGVDRVAGRLGRIDDLDEVQTDLDGTAQIVERNTAPPPASGKPAKGRPTERARRYWMAASALIFARGQFFRERRVLQWRGQALAVAEGPTQKRHKSFARGGV